MKMDEVRKKARPLGVKTSRIRKADLIRAIQSAEGNSPCFGSAGADCDQINCCWRGDCLTPNVR